MKTMLQILAAELVLSGLDDRPVLSRCSVAGNYDPAVAIDISPLVQALDANIDIDHKDGSFIMNMETGEFEKLKRANDCYELELEIVPYEEAKPHLKT